MLLRVLHLYPRRLLQITAWSIVTKLRQGPDLQNIIRQSYDDDRSYDKSYD